MLSFRFPLGVALAAAFLLFNTPPAGAGDAEKCQAAKTKAVGKYLSCRLGVDAKLVAASELPAVDSYTKCSGKLTNSWTKAEAKYTTSCPTTGDNGDIASLGEAVTNYFGDSLAGAPDSCQPPDVEAAIEGCTVAICMGVPTDTDIDPNNCGACAAVCSLPNAAEGCAAGSCTVSSCNAGFSDCNSMAMDGCEVSPSSDPNNCGSCGDACPSYANATSGCTASTCTMGSCDAGFQDCNVSDVDGCESFTTSDPNNCGACGDACPAYPNADTQCVASSCMMGACNADYGDCNASPVDGCEIYLLTDPNNCGNCGSTCPFVAPNCISGACTP